MNRTERQMTDILRKGKEAYGVVSVKAEFEAEGTRMDELLRLVDIARAAGLPLTVKIGGCEAIRDLLEAKQIGVRYIVAPMVETPYALEKYIAAKNMVFDEEDQQDTDFLFNMETITAFDNRQQMIETAQAPKGSDGVVFGRVDFVGSMGRSREAINDVDITERIVEMCSILKNRITRGLSAKFVSLKFANAVSDISPEKADPMPLPYFSFHKLCCSGSMSVCVCTY